MVSIIPGMETAAPLRTLTRSGTESVAPKVLPAASSRRGMSLLTSVTRLSGSVPCSMYSTQARVEIVNPGGTGTPMEVISARLAPLPPRSSFSSRPPSASPFPKK